MRRYSVVDDPKLPGACAMSVGCLIVYLHRNRNSCRLEIDPSQSDEGGRLAALAWNRIISIEIPTVGR